MRAIFRRPYPVTAGREVLESVSIKYSDMGMNLGMSIGIRPGPTKQNACIPVEAGSTWG